MSLMPRGPNHNKRCFVPCRPGSFCECLGERIPNRQAGETPQMIERSMDNAWHGAINIHHDNLRAADPQRRVFHKFMYEGKKAHGELPRLILLHREEREGKLPQLHQQCSMSPVEPIPENHLACCLGVRCKECPELKALETPALTPEQQDEAKAWTCIAHILMEGGDTMNEGFLLTVGDRMFWDRVHESLAAGVEEPPSSDIDCEGSNAV